MAKGINLEDEKDIINSFLQDEPRDHDALVGTDDNWSVPTELPPTKEESRRKHSKNKDYEALFLKGSPVTARKGKMVYIRLEFHKDIQRVCQVIGDGEVSLSAYIDNVLGHHFDTFGNEIKRLYAEKHDGVLNHKK